MSGVGASRGRGDDIGAVNDSGAAADRVASSEAEGEAGSATVPGTGLTEGAATTSAAISAAGRAPAPFRIVDRARWSDVDAAGIVCYGAYLRFFELAETEFFRTTGLTVAHIQEHFGLWLVRRRVECDFYRSILLDEQVEIFAHPVAIGRTSLELAFLVRRLGEREIAVEARYVLVAVDHEELRPVPVPDPVREALAPWLMSREAARAAVGGTEES